MYSCAEPKSPLCLKTPPRNSCGVAEQQCCQINAPSTRCCFLADTDERLPKETVRKLTLGHTGDTLSKGEWHSTVKPYSKQNNGEDEIMISTAEQRMVNKKTIQITLRTGFIHSIKTHCRFPNESTGSQLHIGGLSYPMKPHLYLLDPDFITLWKHSSVL